MEGYFKPPSEYRFVDYTLCMIFVNIKLDLTYKARLCCDGSRVDPRGLSARNTVVKGVPFRFLYLIADSQDLQVLCGDIGNTFVQANTKENIYTCCGSELNIAVIVRDVYGLATSAERFRTMLAIFVRTLGFKTTCFDRDVWMRMQDDESSYNYISTHIDDFKCVAKYPSM